MVEEWLDSGGDVDMEYMVTLLMSASNIGQTHGHERTVELLLARGAAVNHQTANGGTALMMATDNNSLAVVRLLLEARADTNLEMGEQQEESSTSR